MEYDFKPPRPRIIADIRRRGESVFRALPERVNLHYKRVIVVPLSRIAKTGVILAAAAALIFGSVSAPLNHSARGAASDAERQRAEFEAQLRELEAEIDQLEAEKSVIRRQGQTLQSEIDRLNVQIARINLQIRAITISLSQLSSEISETESKIGVTESDIGRNKEAIGKLLQDLYEREGTALIEVMLANPKLSDFFGDMNNLLIVQDSLRVALGRVVALRSELIDQREMLSMQRSDAEALRDYQAAQRQVIERTTSEKDDLLQATKGEEARYQALVQEKQKTATEIRKQIFRLFGGGEMSFEEAYNLARVAEQATGIRAAFIMAVLEQESRLGRNVGQCGPEGAMHPTRDMLAFRRIVDELRAAGELVPSPLLVSCAISAHGAYGGAMGPAQFIPSTWLLYQSDIAEVTGNNPPNPWRNADAFVATALYLKNSLSSSSCRKYASENQNVLPYQFLLERCAAAQYYSGGNWHRFRFVYGDPVVEKADQFQRDINVLTG